MATTDPMQSIELSETQVNERRDILAKRIKQRDKIRKQKGAQVKKWNEQIRLLDDQISTMGVEIDERRAFVPAPVLPGTESAMTTVDRRGLDDDDDDEGDDESSPPPPNPGEALRPGKKKRASKKSRPN